jgi:hypothetical protein
VDDSKFADWTKLELYDGATKVGELTKGPAEFAVKDLKAGYHAFSVLGTDSKGTIRPSNPVLVVVRELAEKPRSRRALRSASDPCSSSACSRPAAGPRRAKTCACPAPAPAPRAVSTLARGHHE